MLHPTWEDKLPEKRTLWYMVENIWQRQDAGMMLRPRWEGKLTEIGNVIGKYGKDGRQERWEDKLPEKQNIMVHALHGLFSMEAPIN